MAMYLINHTFTKKTLLVSGTCLALVACAPEQYNDSIGSRAAGDAVLAQDFGFATSNNVGALNGDLARQMATNLTRIFMAETPATINFAFNRADLDAQARAALQRQAQWMIANPNITFRVFGHTDKVGSNRYNQRLGQRRARAAVNYLISQGVDRRKVEAVISFGETQPLVFTEERNRENRRTVTEVKGFFKRGGAPIDGKYAIGTYNRYVEQYRDLASPIRIIYNPGTSATLSTGIATANRTGGAAAAN